MLVIPAMDIRCGKFVHLLSTPAWEELEDKDDPVEVADWWKKQGIEMLHITDLDGSFTGVPENLDVFRQIVTNLNIPLQVAGGIRSLEHIDQVLKTGVKRVVLGTIAARDPELIGQACQKYGAQVAVGIEGKNDMVAIEGWHQPTDWTIIEMAQYLKDLGVERVVFNDTRRDGSLKGPNLRMAQEVVDKTGLKVILSGGVSSLEDLKEICKLATRGIEGVIVGKALYTGNLTYGEASNLICR